ncbi:DUF4179 domain-containing protein [Nonomuraea candida]|uniref:DUF4179 domain-containing protein n=1 Tax=Nonomuraea candida TaxID=359159 RepID=UPI0005BC7377|nr:DUF4179 domain-containing protein [Nonomuraea candida]
MSGEQRKFELSMPQILGGALAAVTAAVAASYLGVAGTVIGAAVVSVASTVATAVYTHYLKQTGERVKQHTPLIVRREHPAEETRPVQGAPVKDAGEDRGEAPGEGGEGGEGTSTLVMPAVGRRRLPWLKVGAAAAIVFGISMGSILVYEAVAQQTVHDQVTGKTPPKAQQQREDRPADRRDGDDGAPAHQAPQTATQQPVTPGPSVTPTPSGTPAPRPTPTPTPTPTGEVEPSEEATGSPPPEEERPDPVEEPPSDEPLPPPTSADDRTEPGDTPPAR